MKIHHKDSAPVVTSNRGGLADIGKLRTSNHHSSRKVGTITCCGSKNNALMCWNVVGNVQIVLLDHPKRKVGDKENRLVDVGGKQHTVQLPGRDCI